MNKQSPQQRAIARKRSLWRELQKNNPSIPDPDKYDFGKDGKHFDKLSNAEWSHVWKSVRSALDPGSLAIESNVRKRVDDAAYSSGWFVGNAGELHFSSRDYRIFSDKHRSFLKKLVNFRKQLSAYLGQKNDGDRYDPWNQFRRANSLLGQLENAVGREIVSFDEQASQADSDPNAAKRELDVWRARLILIWQDRCGLPVRNTKALRAFLITSLAPYTVQNDKMAKDFIAKWISGKVPRPGFSWIDLNSDESDE